MHQSIPVVVIQAPSPIQSPTTQLSPISEEYRLMNSTQPRHRASRVEQWIEEQQTQDDEHDIDRSLQGATDDPGFNTSQPYLAYPQSSVQSLRTEQCDYTLVNEEDKEKVDIPHTPPQSRSKSVSGIFRTPSPLRNLYLSFSPSRRSPASSKPGSHLRAASLSVADISRDSPSTLLEPSSRRSDSHWSVVSKLQRPSVLGHFSPAANGTLDVDAPRPSSSSNGSYSTRPSFDTVATTASLSSTQLSSYHRKGPSLWSLPSTASHLNDQPGSTKLVSQPSRSTIRVPFHFRPLSYTSDTLSDVLTSKRKKYLVISGIAVDDTFRFEGMRRWCESFGEIRSITTSPNGDIVVSFRKAEVADTVCRVQARVNIAGVGSVGLSWCTRKQL